MRKRTSLLGLLLLALNSPAHASPPDPAPSTFPPVVALVGGQSGTADPLGDATFVIRDLANNPVPSAEVVLDFSACTDVRLSADMAGPGIQVDCANKIVRGLTDANGRIIFRIVGSGAGGPPRAIPACLAIQAQGIPGPSRIVNAYDLDGLNGVSLVDVSMAYADIVAGRYNPLADYDYNGSLGLLDLTILVRAVHLGGSLVSGAPCTP